MSRGFLKNVSLGRVLPWMLTLAILLAVAGLVAGALGREAVEPVPQTIQPVNVDVITLLPQDYRETLVLPALVAADRSVVISAEVAARLVEWRVPEGARVADGDILAVLDTAEPLAAMEEALASLELAKSRERFALAGFQRSSDLAGRKLVSDAELERSEDAYHQAKLAVIQIGKQIDRLQVHLDKAVLRAPFDGILDKHLLDPGEFAHPGEALANVFDLSHVRVRVDVPDRFIPFFDHGNEVFFAYLKTSMPGAEPHLACRVELPGMPKLTGGVYEGLVLDAAIHRVAQAAERGSNTFEVVLRLPNPGRVLREGMIVRAHVEFLRYPGAMVLPMRAAQVSDVGPRVLVVESRGGEDFAVARDIVPVSIQGDRLLVSAGVSPGERLVVTGARNLIGGERVMVIRTDGLAE